MEIRRPARALLLLFLAVAGRSEAQDPQTLRPGGVVDTTLGPPSAHSYAALLRRGESLELAVEQRGIDLVVEVLLPSGALLQVVDSPTGRSGQERVEVIADSAGAYGFRVRPYSPQEPAGAYRLRVVAWRDRAATSELLRSREEARQAAAAWLRGRSAGLPPATTPGPSAELQPFDDLAGRAEVVGLGEATHGSREFADMRIALTQRLIARHGYRLVAIEASESRLAVLDRFISGELAPGAEVTQALESGWIGRRSQRELVAWLRDWNTAHPGDRVHLVGLDAQDNVRAQESVRRLLERAYGSEVAARFEPALREVAAADSQASVFGDATVSAPSRAALFELVTKLELDSPLLNRTVRADSVDRARAAARQLAQFADFNAEGDPYLGHSRDWYMAANLLRAMEGLGAEGRAVYWGHNAHVAAPPDRVGNARPMGTVLREALGCRYAAVAMTFGEGAFVAQVPDDPAGRLETFSLPPPAPGTIDEVLGRLHPSGSVVAWPCPPDPSEAPEWLREPRPMHWVGALFAPGTVPSEAYRPFDLLQDFDAAVYIPRVTADEAPADGPVTPAGVR